MKRVYVVLLRPVDTPINSETISVLDQVMSSFGDWFRFNGLTWFLETDANSADIQKQVRLLLSSNDSVVVLKLDLSEFNGWASPDLWKWLQSKETFANAMTALGGASTGMNALLGGGPTGLGGLIPPFGPHSDKKK
jgi:hypothetical protein